MKMRGSQILVVLVAVGLLVGVPASAQSHSPRDDDHIRLEMLVLINRMALSVDQMEALHNILANMLSLTEPMQTATGRFRDAMIAFRGTPDQLEETLQAFQREQQALRVELRTEWAASLRGIGDVLTLNQGLVLRSAFPSLWILETGTTRNPRPDSTAALSIGEVQRVLRARMQEHMPLLAERMEEAGLPEWRAKFLDREQGDDDSIDEPWRHLRIAARRPASQLDGSAFRKNPARRIHEIVGSARGEVLPLHRIGQLVTALESKLAALED